MGVMRTVLLPARFTVRALEDLHALAEATRWAMDRRTLATTRAREADAKFQALLAVQQATVDVQAGMLRRIETLNAKLPPTEEVLAMIEDLRQSLQTVAGATEPIQDAAESVERVAERIPGGRRRKSR